MIGYILSELNSLWHQFTLFSLGTESADYYSGLTRIDNPTPAFLYVFIIGWLISMGIRIKRKKEIFLKWKITLIAFSVCMCVVFGISLGPILLPYTSDTIQKLEHNPNYTKAEIESIVKKVQEEQQQSISISPTRVIPFYDIARSYSLDGSIDFILGGIIINCLMLFPLGLLAPMLFIRLRSFKAILILGLCISLFIEIEQFINGLIGFKFFHPLVYNFMSYRVTDIDDVIQNTLGAIVGYLVFKLLFKNINLKTSLFKKRQPISQSV